MKVINSLVVVFVACGACRGQSGFSGGFDVSAGLSAGITIKLESKLEPSTPEFGGTQAGMRPLEKLKPGMTRYLTNAKTHELFGYDLLVEPVDQRAGTYRVTFSALSVTPQDLNLSDANIWRVLPPPVFPPPQVVSIGDTMVMDLLENTSTKQKVVDYIRLKRKNCDAETAESDKTGCLNSLVVEARQELAARITQMQGKRDAATVASIKQSQANWEMYRDSACASLATEEKRLECELTLTRSRTHDLGSMY